jgi:hypothetical protein
MTRGTKTPEHASTEGTSRPRGYEQVDKLSVPLPHGTEVTTRVERVAGDRRVPQGVVGRVVRARGGGFDVQIVGVGELWYARDELVPRKPGQLQFALRRAATWDALRPCVVVETVVGSQAWGLANESSDVDPNTLEMLFVPSARASDELGEWLLAEREAQVLRDAEALAPELEEAHRISRLPAHPDQ